MPDRREELVELFKDLAELTALAEQNPQSFRVRAYENAQQGVRTLPKDFENLSEGELAGFRGIGKGTAGKIRQYLETGTIEKLRSLRQDFPSSVVELSRVPGVGPKTVARLRSQLGVESVEALQQALQEGRLRQLEGFGPKSEERLSRVLQRLQPPAERRRRPIADVLPLARRLADELREYPEVERVEICGSVRRLRETVRDLDIVVAARAGAEVLRRFVGSPSIQEVVNQGETKVSALTSRGMAVDVRVVQPQQWGAALIYFTGSKTHNVALRQRAQEKGWSLNEYALAETGTGAVVASRTEEEIYRALDLPFIPAPMRENSGEIEVGMRRDLPAWVSAQDVQGDVHVHTTLSGDGRSPLEDVIAAAADRGLDYFAVTDHAENLARVGAPRDAFSRQRDALGSLADRHPQIRVLHGVELNIDPQGNLDWDAQFRETFDWCVAAVHSHFDLDRAQQTARILRAMEDPSVHAIGHLSGRMIGRRPPMDLDYDAILEKAVETGTAIEINGAPRRLDVASEVLRRALDLDVVFVLSSDAHHTRELAQMEWGVLQSQRGWVSRERVANCWPRARFLQWLESRSMR